MQKHFLGEFGSVQSLARALRVDDGAESDNFLKIILYDQLTERGRRVPSVYDLPSCTLASVALDLDAEVGSFARTLHRRGRRACCHRPADKLNYRVLDFFANVF